MRFLLNAATAMSAVIAFATAALWLRSYWRHDIFGWLQPSPHRLGSVAAAVLFTPFWNN